VLFVLALLMFTLVLAVPLAHRRFWPINVKRPELFLAITVTTGGIVAVAGFIWAISILLDIGIAGGAPASAASSQHALESVLFHRFWVPIVLAVVIEYLICRITHTIFGAQP
jgi:hypothetical protein